MRRLPFRIPRSGHATIRALRALKWLFAGSGLLVLAALCGIAAPIAVPPAHAQRMLEDESSGVFVLPDGLVSAVEFWKSVYATYDTRQVVMHDNRYLHVVYGVLDFRTLAKTRTESQLETLIRDQSEEERQRLIAVLLELDSYKDGIPFQKLTQEQRNIYDAFEDVEELDKFAAAAERVRGQRGQADRFLNGIAEVAPYMPELEQIFRAKGLPTDLTRLVFVESMFNLHAYSKVGAAGPWQFMSYTGKRFLTISPEVDERMDPILATQGAANLLHENYSHLGDWGLALTAYNHGVAGMRRAAAEVGSTDIGQIVWAYESRSFGFASRNFYAEFLAARDVYNNRERYFGAAALAALPLHVRVPYDEILLPDYVAVGTLAQYCHVTAAELKELNPSLTRYVLSGQKYLPKAYPLKVPAGKGKLVVKGYADIPSTHRYVAQKANEFHVVRKGENLASISKKYGMTVDGLVDLNGISSKNRIRTGQKLRVLAKEGVAVAAATATPAKPKKPEVKVVAVVKLPEDVAAEKTVAAATASANNTEPPVPELPEEQEELLAQAEAPAIDRASGASEELEPAGSSQKPKAEALVGRMGAKPLETVNADQGRIDGKSVALADSAAVPPAPYAPPAATALARGTLAFATLSAALTIPKAPVAIAEQPIPAAGASELSVTSAADAALAPIGPAAIVAAIPPATDLAALGPTIRPATAPLAPARDRANAREGRPAATYPGGIRCALTGR